MKSSWRSPDGGSSVARNTKIEPCGAVFCAWWGTGSTPIRSFHTVSLRGWVNKGPRSLLCRLTPEPRDPSPDDYGHPDGYELAYSVPCANPYHHLPEEAPRLHTPVHVALHVTPKWRVLSPFQVRVRYNQD